MPLIQIELTDEEDLIIAKAAKTERRSKRHQVAHAALAYCIGISEGLIEPSEPKRESAQPTSPQPQDAA